MAFEHNSTNTSLRYLDEDETTEIGEPEMECLEPSCIYSLASRAGISLALSVLFIAILVGNSLLCHLIATNKRLRNSSTTFSILHLAVIDIIFTLFSMPVMVMQLYIVDEWIFGKLMCKMVSFVQSACMIAAILNLSIISIEKFAAIFTPWYLTSKPRIVKTGFAITWIIAITFASYYLTVKDVITFDGKTYCFENWETEESRRVYVLLLIVLFYFVPLCLIIILHSMLIFKLRFDKTAKLMEMVTEGRNRRPSKLHPREKARNTLILIICLFALCCTPYNILMLWVEIQPPEEITRETQHLYTAFLWLIYFNCATHPVIYGLMSKRYKQAFVDATRSIRSRKWSMRYSKKESRDKGVISPAVEVHKII